MGAGGSLVVQALRYKPEGRGFETNEVNFFFYLRDPSSHTRPRGLLGL
jgi:hypothetical protein